MWNRVALVFCLLGSVPCANSWSQGSAGSEGSLEPRYLVDIPTAGMLGSSGFALEVDFYKDGGVLMSGSIGILGRLSLGLSYGGTRLIGSEEPVMNPRPGYCVKVRVIEESMVLPAILVGFDTQGKDGYLKDLDRYAVKSPGFYAVASKNYTMLGFFSIHGGINYSLEDADDDRDMNLFAGIEKTLGPFLSLVMEYNAALNDTDGKAIGRGRGYLNAGLKWSVGSGLTLGFHFKDLTKNGGDVHVGNRTVKLEYVATL